MPPSVSRHARPRTERATPTFASARIQRNRPYTRNGSRRHASRPAPTRFEASDKRVDTRFSAVDERFNALDAKFEARFDALSTQIRFMFAMLGVLVALELAQTALPLLG